MNLSRIRAECDTLVNLYNAEVEAGVPTDNPPFGDRFTGRVRGDRGFANRKASAWCMRDCHFRGNRFILE